MRREMFVWAARGVGFAVGLAVVYAIATGVVAAGRVLLLVFVAVLLASGLEPVIGWLRARLPVGRATTILVVYLAFFVGVMGLALIVVPGALNQLDDLSTRIPPFLDEARRWASGLTPRALATSTTALIDAARDTIAPRRPQAPEPGEVVEAGLTVVEVVISVGTLLAIVFFWLTEHARLQRYALAFLPANRRAGARETWNEVEQRLGSWVRGQLILMTAVGVAAGIAYALLGLDSPILLGLLAGLLEAIPIVGPLLGAIPALLVASTEGIELVILVGLVYVAIQFVEANVLVPIVMRNTIGISPFLVIVSLLIGGALGGIAGAFVAVPMVAALEVVLERLQARDHPVAQDPLSAATPDAEVREVSRRTLPDSAGPEAIP